MLHPYKRTVVPEVTTYASSHRLTDIKDTSSISGRSGVHYETERRLGNEPLLQEQLFAVFLLVLFILTLVVMFLPQFLIL